MIFNSKERTVMIKTIAYLQAALILILPSAVYPVEISFFLGDVTLVRNGKMNPVAVGKKLQTGDLLKTGKGSFLEVSYPDGSKIKLNESSSATIGSRNIAGSDRVSLLSGTATGSIKKLLKGSAKSYTPTIVCAVRGTEYTLTVSSGGDSRVDVTEGIVEIISPGGSATVGENGQLETPMGGKPSPSRGSREEWKTNNDRDFEKNAAARSGRYDRQLKALDERTRETGNVIVSVQNAVAGADSRESLEKAGDLLNSASEKTEDDLLMNEALHRLARDIADSFQGRDPAVSERFRTIEKQSGLVAEQQKKNLASLQKIRDDYLKARDRILGTYKNKIDEIKSKFKNKKSDI